eukprot:1501565-Pleurochrysis_carterae.AAC.1
MDACSYLAPLHLPPRVRWGGKYTTTPSPAGAAAFLSHIASVQILTVGRGSCRTCSTLLGRCGSSEMRKSSAPLIGGPSPARIPLLS